MSIDFNRSFLGGRLTSDPKPMASGKGVRFTVASNKRYRDKDGESKEETLFMPCVAWSKLADLVLQRCEKGSSVFVEGRLEERRFEGDDGKEVRFINLVANDVRFLDGAKKVDTTDTPSNLPAGIDKSSYDALQVMLNQKDK